MIRKSVIICFTFILLAVSFSVLHGDNGQHQPKAVILNSIYKFDLIPEGTKIVHDFVIQNKGDAPLEIVKIDTG